MIRFKPLGETRVDDVARALEDLYAENAIASAILEEPKILENSWHDTSVSRECLLVICFSLCLRALVRGFLLGKKELSRRHKGTEFIGW